MQSNKMQGDYFRKKGFSQDIAPVSNILQCAELSILGVTFQQNCKYSSHVRAKVIKANKSLFVLGSLRKEGMSQEEVDHLFNAIVLPNFSYALPGLWCLRFRLLLLFSVIY